jgi:hypothetical protein
MRAVHAGVLVLAAAIGFAPALPPEHIHEGHDEAGHYQSVAHRHAAPHHFAHAEKGAVFDDVDPAIVLDAQSIGSAKVVIARPAFDFVTVVPLPATTGHVATLVPLTYPIHGPPRSSTALRAPPRHLTL